MANITLSFILTVLIAAGIPAFVFAQDAPAGVSPSDFPEPSIWPQKDLDLFEMSSLKSGGLGEPKSGSSFGKYQKQKSNAELNKPSEKEGKGKKTTRRSSKKLKSLEEEESYSEVETSFEAPVISKQGKLWTWVDQDGVFNVTNDISTVPLAELIKSGPDDAN